MYARTTTPLDLVQKAWPGTVAKDAILTGTDAEYLLQEMDTLSDHPSIGEGSEVVVLLI